MNEMESMLRASQDDEVVGLEVSMGMERNYARCLDSEGKHEEAKSHWKKYYALKKDYERAMEKYLTDEELLNRALSSLKVKNVDKFFKEHPDSDFPELKKTWENLKEEDKEYRLTYLVAKSRNFPLKVREKAVNRFNELLEERKK